MRRTSPLPELVPTPAGLGASEVVIHTVTAWVDSGALPRGGRLPAMRVLAAHFGIDKNTASRACRSLAENGLVRRIGEGNHARLEIPVRPPPAPLSNTVLLISSFSADQLAGNPAPGRTIRIVTGILSGLREAGLDVLLVGPQAITAAQVAGWHKAGLSGIVVAEAMDVAQLALLEGLRQGSTAIAIYGDVLDLPLADSTCSDHAQGARLVVRHLVSRGCRRLLPIVTTDTPRRPWQSMRLNGYTAAAAEAGVELLAPRAISYALPTDRTTYEQHARQTAGELADLLTGPNPPDGILTWNDGHAGAVIAACGLLHRPVHSQIAVAGYDHLWDDLVDRHFNPIRPCCTIDKDNDAIGRELARLVAQRRLGHQPRTAQHTLIPSRLVELP